MKPRSTASARGARRRAVTVAALGALGAALGALGAALGVNGAAVRVLGPALGVVGAGLAWVAVASAQPPTQAAPPAAVAPAASAPTLRAEIATPLQAAQALLQAGRAAEALAQVRLAEAVPAASAHERQTVLRMKGSSALALRDEALALQAFQAALETGAVPVAEQTPLLLATTRAALALGQGAAVQRWGRAYLQHGGREPAVRLGLARTLLAAGDAPGAIEQTRALLAEPPAGTPPREETLQLQLRAQRLAKDEAGLTATLEALATHHPRPAVWNELVVRVQGADDFADRLTIDAYRLLRHTRALGDAEAHAELARLATRAGAPAEALAVLNEALAQPRFAQGPEAAALRTQRDKAAAAVAAEGAQRGADEKSARAAADGGPLFALGLAVAAGGEAAAGLAWMNEALAKGLKAGADDAHLRLGMAQLQAGRRAEAEQTLGRVQGRDGAATLARLWRLTRP